MRAHHVLAIAAILLSARAVAAQNTALDRARRAIQDAGNAGTKAVTNAANQQISSAVQNVATQDVADGSFSAVLSPWSSSDGKSRVELARYGGSAYEVTAATGRQVILCDNAGTIPWQVTFAIGKAAAGTPVAGRGAAASTSTAGGGRGTAAGGRGTRGGGGQSPAPPPPPPPAPAAASAGRSAGGGGADTSGSSGASAKAPTADEIEYRFPSTAVTVTLPMTGAKAGVPGAGSLRVGDASATIFIGAAKLRFLQATVPGDTKKDVVDFGVAFKARVVTVAQSATGCTALAKLPLDTSKTVARGKGSAAPGAAVTPAAAPAAPPAAMPAPAGPTFTAGDVLVAKIDGMKLLAESRDSAKVMLTIKKTDDLVFLGDEQNGYLHVQSSAGDGWIRKVLVMKKP